MWKRNKTKLTNKEIKVPKPILLPKGWRKKKGEKMKESLRKIFSHENERYVH